MTDEQIKLAAKDPIWRIHNLYWVRDKNGRAVKFTPWPEQEKFLRNIWYRNIIPKARQRGFSTVVQIMMLDACIFVPLTAAGILTTDLTTSIKIFGDKIKFAWDRMPSVIHEGNPLTKKTETEYQWENGSSIYVAASVRGTTLQYLHVSEYGKIAKTNPHKAQEIETGGLPTVDAGGVIVIESTVESANDNFSEKVKQAQKVAQLGRPLNQQEYRLHFASWWDADEYEADPTYVTIAKEDAAYFERVEADIQQPISARKRAWYVLKRDNDFSGDQEKMWSQYPSTLEEALRGSTEGRWLARQMALVRTSHRIMRLPHRPDIPVDTYWDIGVGDDIAIWFGQEDSAWTNWINFWEGSDVPYSVPWSDMQNMGYVWGVHYLPHDADHRHPDAHEIRTTKDMLQQLGMRRIEIVPRITNLVEGINQLRDAMASYRFDEENCKAGLEHCDEYAKVWSNTLGIFVDQVLKNGHQHGVDALRQHAQMRFSRRQGNSPKRPKRRNRGGMVA